MREKRVENILERPDKETQKNVEMKNKKLVIEMGLGKIGVHSAIRDGIPALILTRLKNFIPPGQKIPGIEKGDIIPEDSIILEISFLREESIMSMINSLCGVWAYLMDTRERIE